MVEGMSSSPSLVLKSSTPSLLPERLMGSLTARLGLRCEEVSPVIVGRSQMTVVEAAVSGLQNNETKMSELAIQSPNGILFNS